ncbi:MAG: putative PEP-binding protein, partial [Gemmatimonadota bacterium]
AEVVRSMRGKPVVIRTLDLGADKMGQRPLAEREHNPFLGLRSILLSLRNLDLFRPQLRAILRAAVHGDARVMFPLITTVAGLTVAIPAAMAYNYYASKLSFFSGELEGFSSEFIGTLAREGRL